ncbi:hypothetical protein ACE2AJ_16475 [Aquihabitans daechungensis]|uniref:hypothetical protein n=1 Tax=Aquihabitans daechungensis TaxID=1052257 RepID=UPI003B9E4FFE
MIDREGVGALLRCVGLAGALLLAGVGCSEKGSSSEAREAPSTTVFQPYLICDLIDLALEPMREDGTSFVELLNSPAGRKDDGTRAMVALGLMARGRKQAGPFKPVLVFLAERSVAESSTGDTPHLTDSIRANARKLDRFVADGGCG